MGRDSAYRRVTRAAGPGTAPRPCRRGAARWAVGVYLTKAGPDETDPPHRRATATPPPPAALYAARAAAADRSRYPGWRDHRAGPAARRRVPGNSPSVVGAILTARRPALRACSCSAAAAQLQRSCSALRALRACSCSAPPPLGGGGGAGGQGPGPGPGAGPGRGAGRGGPGGDDYATD